VVRVLLRDENRLVLRLEPFGAWLALVACVSTGLGLGWVARSDPAPFLWIAAIIFLGFGVLILLLMRFIELHLERNPGQVQIRRWGVFSPNETFSWPLEQFGVCDSRRNMIAFKVNLMACRIAWRSCWCLVNAYL
jgi:hypothetical protein